MRATRSRVSGEAACNPRSRCGAYPPARATRARVSGSAEARPLLDSLPGSLPFSVSDMISSSNDRPTAQTAATCMLSGLTILSIIFISIAIQGRFQGPFSTRNLISHHCWIARTCIQYVRTREIAEDQLTREAGRRGGDPGPQPDQKTGPGGGAAPGPVGIGMQDTVKLADIRRNAGKHQDD